MAAKEMGLATVPYIVLGHLTPALLGKAIGNHLVRSWGRECADDDLELIGQLLARQPVEVMQRLARHFTPSALARQGLAERDMAIRALSVGRQGTSGHEMARDIRRDLRRAVTTWFRPDRPGDPRRRQLHRVLVLNRGKIPSERALRRVLAGLGGPNSLPVMAQDPEYPLSRQEPRFDRCSGPMRRGCPGS
jgi:hypothetical protein